MKRIRIATALMLLVILLVQLAPVCADSGITITSHPETQTVVEGGSCTFRASAKGNNGITWRLCSPDGREDFPFTNAPDHFPGLRISGKNSNKLTLKNIPGEMDGWLVYCRYSTKSAREDTDYAFLYVTDPAGNRLQEDAAPAATPAPPHTSGGTLPSAGTDLVLRTYGSYIQFIDGDGNAKGASFTELNFGEDYYNTLTRKTVRDNSVDVRITADIPKGQHVEYWIINGAKYTFNTEVKSFTLRELTYGMTIEAVFSNSKTVSTLPAADEIQQQRSGETLLVETKSARMSHVDSQHKAGGGYFTEFDFTDDFINQATNSQETGGRVTVQVKASIPEGKVVTFWRFNGARLNFNSDVTAFVVENLFDSMLYQPVFYTKTTPAPEYTVRCSGCTFSGGGYSGATSGTVPYGTTIRITPNRGSSLGYWTGSYSAGSYSNNVSNKTITFKVTKNCSFTWHATIN